MAEDVPIIAPMIFLFPHDFLKVGAMVYKTFQHDPWQKCRIVAAIKVPSTHDCGIKILTSLNLSGMNFLLFAEVRWSQNRLIPRPLGRLAARVTSAFPMFQRVQCLVYESKCLWNLMFK